MPKFEKVEIIKSNPMLVRSEANDVAIQMARAYTGNYDVVVFEDGFHGSLGN
jgi:4-aminobutyrate aminotransferase-like enzyme